MAEIIARVIRRADCEAGQALAEYSLALAFIAIVCVVAVSALGVAITGSFDDITGGF